MVSVSSGRGFKFTSKKQSEKGIMATVLGAIAMISFVFMIIVSFHGRGNATERMGAVGFVAFIFSLVGLVLGIMSCGERDTFRLWPRVGLVLCILSLIGWGYLVMAGAGVVPGLDM